MLSKSGSACMPSAGPSTGAKRAGHVETMRSIAGSSCHLTRSATASPAMRRSAATISPTPTWIPGTLIERVSAKLDAGASWPTIRFAMTVRGDDTHTCVLGATGQIASTPESGSRMMPLANADVELRFGLAAHHRREMEDRVGAGRDDALDQRRVGEIARYERHAWIGDGCTDDVDEHELA